MSCCACMLTPSPEDVIHAIDSAEGLRGMKSAYLYGAGCPPVADELRPAYDAGLRVGLYLRAVMRRQGGEG